MSGIASENRQPLLFRGWKTGLDAQRYRQWSAVRHAIEEVLHRWHPEFFPPAGASQDELNPATISIYTNIYAWSDPDLLAVHLTSLERQTPGLQPGDAQRVRAAAAELLALDFDAIIDREGRAEPDA